MLNRTVLLLTLILLTTSSLAWSQVGSVHTDSVMNSEILDREMGYSVWLPESYDRSDRDYPVLYLMHGMTGDYTDWVVKGEVMRIAGEAVLNGDSPEVIIVMPDGLYDAFYINNYDGSFKWEDFFHEEFMPEIEDRYRIMANRNSRLIAGLSMGGYGAMYHAVKYKEKFSAVYAMSAAFLEVEPLQEGEERGEWSRDFNLKTWGPENEEGYPENYKEHSIQEIFKAMSDDEITNRQAPLPAIFIDCGDDDFLLEENMNLVAILNSRGVPFEFRVRDGGHTWEYWRTALEKTMVFVGDQLRN
ncbi:MAG: esterase family protein [Balneolaceae bacterium]|nr:esterase family protein [Balneolaceae bacterium]MCH8548793.1 esterase family protein [Balneolaceae bacterium]